jgi:hypothetical protein
MIDRSYIIRGTSFKRSEQNGWNGHKIMMFQSCVHARSIGRRSVEMSVSVPFLETNGSEKGQTFPIKPFSAPVYVGKISFQLPPMTISRGNARD